MKQTIVVRADLSMSIGKTAAQVAHAAIEAYKAAKKKRSWVAAWEAEGMKKVVLQVDTLEALRLLEKKARAANIPTALIKDAGLTEIPSGSITCLGIGPAPDELINKITGSLKSL